MKNPSTAIPGTTNPRTVNHRISNPLKTISKPNLQSKIKDPQSLFQGFFVLTKLTTFSHSVLCHLCLNHHREWT